jgi:hypothetical protein
LSFTPVFVRTRREGSRIPGGRSLESSIFEGSVVKALLRSSETVR